MVVFQFVYVHISRLNIFVFSFMLQYCCSSSHIIHSGHRNKQQCKLCVPCVSRTHNPSNHVPYYHLCLTDQTSSFDCLQLQIMLEKCVISFYSLFHVSIKKEGKWDWQLGHSANAADSGSNLSVSFLNIL